MPQALSTLPGYLLLAGVQSGVWGVAGSGILALPWLSSGLPPVSFGAGFLLGEFASAGGIDFTGFLQGLMR